MKKRTIKFTAFAALLSTALLVTGCGGDLKILGLEFSGVEPLTNGYHYEGWAIIDGEAISTGKFNVDASGNIVTTDGVEIPNGEFETDMDLSNATAIVISIEPSGDTDDIPSSTKFLAGDVIDDGADLTVGATQALGDDYTNAAGKYILATPTDGPGTNELSGVWFLDITSGLPEVGLTLPTLPEGWKYEGWAVINGEPVTTGTFTAVDMADDAAPYSGTQAGPDFPGEDFLQNAPSGLTFPTDLSGTTVVISVEPDPDDNAAPFAIKPLTADVPDPAMDHETYDMTNQSVTLPTGVVDLK